jgi:acetyl esterase/lipase
VTLDPQLRAFLDEVEAAGLPKLNELTPAQARQQARDGIELIGRGPDVALVEDFTIPTQAGERPARRYEPGEPTGTILWIHGGGWVICDLDTHDAMCRMLALASGFRVIGLDYRRAPEDPFPAPLDDAWDALNWVAAHYGDRALVLGGDSAGGNLAAVCTHRARDRSGPGIDLQVLVYPVTDHDFTTDSYRVHGSGRDTFLTSEEMTWFWDQYAPGPVDRDDPELSPLRARSLTGLPPAIVVTAEYDPLRDEGLAYAQRLREAGNDVRHHHYDGMTHAFFSFVNAIPRGNDAVAQVGAEIRRRIAGE